MTAVHFSRALSSLLPLCLAGAAVAQSTPPSPPTDPAQSAAPAAPTNQELLERLERLEQIERENHALRVQVDQLTHTSDASRARDAELAADLSGLGSPGSKAGGDAHSAKLTDAGRKLAESGLSQAFGGLYTKPFLTSAGGIALGGYVDLTYRNAQGADGTFSFDHLIPFIYAQPSEHVKFATEIEIEDGHEVEVEFAVIDLTFSDPFNFRAGVLLSPLGKFNLVHDSPVNELTDRPLVDRTVIPTTLREAGLGGFGTLASADSVIGQVTWEAYATTGFKGLLDDGTAGFDTSDGLAEGRPHETLGTEDPFKDINNQLSGIGRVEWSPTLGTALGLSGHTGTYDEGGKNNLTIVALDAALDGRALSRMLGATGAIARFLDGFELLGEAAHAHLERDALARSAGIPDRLAGWYAQANYRLYADFLQSFEQRGWLDDGSHFTLVTRYDQIDLDGAERKRWTFGANFRPNRWQTVLKLEYQLNSESGSNANLDDDAFVASIATYF